MAHRPLIAVVDDDDSVRESLGGLFRSVGFAVQVFPSAADFLKSDDLPKTACVILDVRMPGMTGLELQRRLGASHRELPVIFMTAHDDAQTRSQALNDGAVDYLIKPFSEEALLDAVHAALNPQ
jgi:FixJ family two-component response regulator